MVTFNEVVDPAETAADYQRSMKSFIAGDRSDFGSNIWAHEANMLAHALIEVRGQLAEAEHQLHDLGLRPVRLTDAVCVPCCAREPSAK